MIACITQPGRNHIILRKVDENQFSTVSFLFYELSAKSVEKLHTYRRKHPKRTYIGLTEREFKV